MFVFLSCHSVATWQFVDLCLYRHATLPIGFPRRISRLVVGYYLKEHEPNLLLKRYLLCSLMGALPKDQFAFSAGIGRYDYFLAFPKELPQDFKLFPCGGISFESFVGFDNTNDQTEPVRHDGQHFSFDACNTIVGR